MEYQTLPAKYWQVYRQVVNSKEMRNWKRLIMERDKYACQKCGSKGSVSKRFVATVVEIGHQLELIKEHLDRIGRNFDNYYVIEGCSLFRVYKSNKLHVHHIEPLGMLLQRHGIENLSQAMKCLPLWDLNNGISLCRDCHYDTDFERRKSDYGYSGFTPL